MNIVKLGWFGILFLMVQVIVGSSEAATDLMFAQADLMTVSSKPFFKSIEGLGTVEAVHRATLSAPLSAPLIYINKHVGQHVGQGVLLARLDDSLLQRQLASQQASYRAALIQLSKDRLHFRNGLSLYRENFLSKTAFQDLLSQYEAADAAASVIEAEIHQTQLSIARTKIIAPFAGVISSVAAELGQTMNTGQPLVTMVDPSSFQVKIQLPVSALSEVHLGDVVSFVYPKGLGYGQGALTFMAPQLTGQSQTVVVYSNLPKVLPYFLPEGLFLKVYIRTHYRADAVLVPMSAVHYEAQGAYVYKISSDHQITRAFVKTGLAYDGEVAIQSGLSAGDLIVARDLGTLAVNQVVKITS